MKGCFVFPHKEMKKANKGFRFFYGSPCWARPVSTCPAQTDPLGTGIHPRGRKTFPGGGLRLPSLFALGRGSLDHFVCSLLGAFRPVLSSLFSMQRKEQQKGEFPSRNAFQVCWGLPVVLIPLGSPFPWAQLKCQSSPSP